LRILASSIRARRVGDRQPLQQFGHWLRPAAFIPLGVYLLQRRRLLARDRLNIGHRGAVILKCRPAQC
jgi:hypothetical protein